MAQNIRYIARNEWVKALGKAFHFLQDMTIPGTASEAHAQAKGLIKLVFDSIELEEAKELENFKQKEAANAQRLQVLGKLSAQNNECCFNVADPASSQACNGTVKPEENLSA